MRMLDNVIDINFYTVPEARFRPPPSARLVSALWAFRMPSIRCASLMHLMRRFGLRTRAWS